MKRVLSIFLAVLLVILQVPNIGFAYGEGNPNLVISNSNTYTAKAGETVSVSVQLTNTGNGYATNISGSLSGESTGVVYVDGSSHDSIRNLRDGSTGTLSFRVKVDESADGKNYSLPLNITYYNEGYYIDKEDGSREYVQPQKFTLTENINIRVAQDKTSPQLVVNRVDIMPSSTVNAGETIAVGFEIGNIGSAIAKDLRVTLEGLTNEGFTLANGVNYKTVQSLESGKKTYIYFELKSSKTLAGGSYELKLDLSYKDAKNQAIQDKSNFFITVAGNKGQSSNLIIENLVSPTGSIGQNKEVDISFDIRNQGQADAKNVVITASSEDQSGVVPKTVSTIKLNSLAKGATEKVNFKFLTTKASETKNYPIKITVKYVDDLGKEDTVEQFVGVFVVAPETGDSTKGKPKLIIDKYSFQPQLVKAGENFEMTLSFYNTSSNKAVKNIKIFLTAESGATKDTEKAGNSAFTPVDSSNTFYIDSIPPKGRVEKTITMFTVPDAIAKTHTITANFEYEDSEGTELKDIELIGVPVVQQSRLETAELQLYPDAMVGQPLPVSLEFYNTGKVTLYNMMVKLEGDFQTENGSYYVGNFDSGSSEFFEGMVIPSQPGELTGAVLFTYEDSTGQKQELRKEFTLNVTEMPPMEEFPGEMPPPDDMKSGGIKGILKSKWLWISLVIIGAGVGGFIFYKKKKKEKEMALDE
ncbi:CARDB domain-containing protein [uncultured Tissierella sp.]|uniref:COG1361 S-layer family protein n=1 Tax=uncultured Tissierella sp. TaxID=448160 RepID=UPI0028056A93|nr:CARDB domain-containing protein [uncultured Tissierella sp.]MDU5082067.1 CARDB domain-containing protein [Bacillota bacterium]